MTDPLTARLSELVATNNIWTAYHDYPHPMVTMIADVRKLLAERAILIAEREEARAEICEANGILRFAMEAIEGGRSEPLAIARTAIINFFNSYGFGNDGS